MGFLSGLFGFSPRPDDVKMWRSGKPFRQCHDCPDELSKDGPTRIPQLHHEEQDKNCEAWRLLEELIDKAARKGSKEFSPGLEMPPELWPQIITLPPSIAKLTSVRRLYLYGSYLVRIPPEIGAMTKLEELDIYTSYRLHWLPYEITRCPKLKRSRASTRALYGNYKLRMPFPELPKHFSFPGFAPNNCSVCQKITPPESLQPVWISLRVATDVFPLLVHACSIGCIQKLPKPPQGYLEQPHSGGLSLQQPEPGHPVGGRILTDEELEHYFKTRRPNPVQSLLVAVLRRLF